MTACISPVDAEVEIWLAQAIEQAMRFFTVARLFGTPKSVVHAAVKSPPEI
jgi:hypothetical protein